MYNTASNDYEIMEKNSHVLTFLEFVAAKFNINLSFVQLFISLHWLKIKIYNLTNVLKKK